MKKIFSKIIGVLCIAAMVPSFSVGAVAIQKINARAFSDEAYIFRIKGSNQKFLLLDETDDNNSKFFVCGIGYYGRKAINSGGKHKFDPNDPQSMAYFLNNEFLTQGTLSGFKLNYHKLPDKIIEHIDFNHVWDCEEAKPGGDAGAPYKIKCGVVLPSQTELIKYKDIIGWDDNYRSFDNDVTLYPWGTRSVSNDGYILSARANVNMTQLSTFGTTTELMGIRPVFYLDLNFFKDVRIDIANSGKKVIELFKKYYTLDDMKKIYNEQECYDYLGYKTDINISYKDGVCELVNNIGKEVDGILMTVYFDEGHFPVGQRFSRVSIKAGEKISVETPVDMNYKKAHYAQISVCEPDEEELFRMVSNSQRVNMK